MFVFRHVSPYGTVAHLKVNAYDYQNMLTFIPLCYCLLVSIYVNFHMLAINLSRDDLKSANYKVTDDTF